MSSWENQFRRQRIEDVVGGTENDEVTRFYVIFYWILVRRFICCIFNLIIGYQLYCTLFLTFFIVLT
jgi:hypothetical protein